MNTDYNPLTYVLASAKLNATGLRWIGELADFNFTNHHRPGKINIDASLENAFIGLVCKEISNTISDTLTIAVKKRPQH